MPNEQFSGAQSGPTRSHIYNNSTMPWPGINWSQLDTYSQLTRFRNSLVTPGYASRKRTGTLPENTFGFSEMYYTALTGKSLFQTQDTPSKWTASLTLGKIGPLWNQPVPWSASFLQLMRVNQANELAAKLHKKVLDSDIDLSVVAGEFRETASMFRDLAIALFKARYELGRGNFRGAASGLALRNNKDWANAWLLANYGIRPLVNDVLGAIKALEKGMLKRGFVVERSRVLYEDNQLVQSGDIASGLWTVDWKLKMERSMRVKYTTSQPYLATLSSLGLSNPFGLIWELTKLSFVVDWAIGVGSWLSQLGSFFGREFETGSETAFTRITGHAQYIRYTSGVTTWDVAGTMVYENADCTREGLSSFPIAMLPALKDPASLYNVVTSIALLRQRS